MAEFKVETIQLQNYASQISAMQRELDSVAVRLGAMQLGSILQIKASTALIGKVADCKWAAAHQSDDLGRLATGLSEIAELYNNCEKNLSEPKTQAQVDAQEEAHQAEEEADNWFLEFLDNVPILDFVGNVLDYTHVPGSEIISLLISFINGTNENYLDGEHGFQDPRFYFEIINEALIDWGLGNLALTASTAITAVAVPAIAAALGVTAPAWVPVVAAAGGAILITWAANGICEAIFDKDISELVSDAVIDFGEWAFEEIGEAVDAAGEFIDNAVDAVEDTVNTVVEHAEAAWNDFADTVEDIWPF